jgi:hypothetical protein
MSQEQPPGVPPAPPSSGPFAFPPPPDQPQEYGSSRSFYPLDFDAITRNAASIFRFAWRPLLAVALIPNLVIYVFMVPLSAIASPGLNRWLDAYLEALPRRDIPPIPEELRLPLVLLGLVAFASVLTALVVSAAVVEVADAVFRGRPVSVRGALGIAVRRAPALIGAQLLLFLAGFGVVLLGLLLASVLMVGGGAATFLGLIVMVGAVAALMFLTVRWTLLVQTVVLEKVGSVEGLSRSWRLVAGSGWRVLGYIILLALVTGVIGAIVGAVPQAILRFDGASSTGAAIGTVFDGLAATLLAPIAPLVTLFLYYDLRFNAREAAPQPGEAREVA